MLVGMPFWLQPIAVMFIGSERDCCKFIANTPLELRTIPTQLKPDEMAHCWPAYVLGLKPPVRKRMLMAIAITSSTQPYVVRYSMALCSLMV